MEVLTFSMADAHGLTYHVYVDGYIYIPSLQICSFTFVVNIPKYLKNTELILFPSPKPVICITMSSGDNTAIHQVLQAEMSDHARLVLTPLLQDLPILHLLI